MKLPPLYLAADRASRKAQAKYLWVTRAQLWGLVIGAALSIEAWPAVVGPMRVGAASLLAVSALATLLAASLSLRDTWYSGRAAAESVKTLAWRFAAGADPFPTHLPTADAEGLFLTRLKDVLRDISLEGVRLDVQTEPGSGQITEDMRTVRQASEMDRLRTYVEQRVQDQVKWYWAAASKNDGQHELLTWVAGGFQSLAVVVAIVMATHPEGTVNPVGLLTTVAAAVIAWSEKKGHQELAHAYSLTAHELQMALSEAETTGRSEVPRFVLDTEQAISREHTLWIARRTGRRSPLR